HTALSSRLLSSFYIYYYDDHRDLHSFPTRRSSDLPTTPSPVTRCNDPAISPSAARAISSLPRTDTTSGVARIGFGIYFPRTIISDRKSTRLNSSHVKISYAVFCLKKKNKKEINMVK